VRPKELHSWSVYRLKGTPAVLVGIVEAPDEESAINTDVVPVV
jgi:hypothetical protein